MRRAVALVVGGAVAVAGAVAGADASVPSRRASDGARGFGAACAARLDRAVARAARLLPSAFAGARAETLAVEERTHAGEPSASAVVDAVELRGAAPVLYVLVQGETAGTPGALDRDEAGGRTVTTTRRRNGLVGWVVRSAAVPAGPARAVVALVDAAVDECLAIGKAR